MSFTSQSSGLGILRQGPRWGCMDPVSREKIKSFPASRSWFLVLSRIPSDVRLPPSPYLISSSYTKNQKQLGPWGDEMPRAAPSEARRKYGLVYFSSRGGIFFDHWSIFWPVLRAQEQWFWKEKSPESGGSHKIMQTLPIILGLMHLRFKQIPSRWKYTMERDDRRRVPGICFLSKATLNINVRLGASLRCL